MNESKQMPRALVAAITVVAVLLAFGLFCHYRAYANVRRVKELQVGFRSGELPPEQRRERGEQMRAAMDKLTPTQRRELSAERQRQFEERMRNYTKMSKEEKKKFLDGMIDRTNSMRQQFGNSGSFNRGLRNGPSADDRERSRRLRLDQTTPEFRAAMDQFRRDMEERRRERSRR